MSQPAATTALDGLSSVSAEPTQPTSDEVYDNTLMSFLAGMFLMLCVFAILGIYCQAQRRRKYKPYEWNNNATFMAPFHLCQINSFRESHGEKVPILHSAKHNTVTLYSKYPKINRKFSYFVTIPEEDENDQDSRKLPAKLFPKSFPH